MKFLTILAILAIVLCGGMVLVAADYYIEFQTQAAPSSSRSRRQQVEMINNLYACKGVPEGTQAFAAVRSQCAQVTHSECKDTIYTNCNFYNVHNPNLQNHMIKLSDRRYFTTIVWNLGFLNHAIDHPNFAEPSQEVVTFHMDRLVLLGTDIVPFYMAQGLAIYFAQDNLIDFSRDPVRANSLFLGLKTLLGRIMNKYAATYQETDTPTTMGMRIQIESAMRLVLRKMIDPCSVLLVNLQRFASEYCATYCNFLRFASGIFRTSRNRCSVEDGNCVGTVCTCNKILPNPFAGCPVQNSATTPMQLCHNYMRTENNL